MIVEALELVVWLRSVCGRSVQIPDGEPWKHQIAASGRKRVFGSCPCATASLHRADVQLKESFGSSAADVCARLERASLVADVNRNLWREIKLSDQPCEG